MDETVALIVTSPPYANLLNRRRRNKSRRGDSRKNDQYLQVEQYSQDPRDRRTRPSVMVEWSGHRIVIDSGPDFREQAVREGIDRLDAVLSVIYLVFNEGYYASSGESVTRSDLSNEAIRLGRLLMELLPEPEVAGLLALMLLTDARRAARTDAGGALIPLDEQDRALWNRDLIAEEVEMLQAQIKSTLEQMVGISKSLAVIKTLKVTLNGHDDFTELGKKNANGKESRRSMEDR